MDSPGRGQSFESPTQFHSAAFVRDKMLDKWRFMAQKMGLMRVSAETLNKGFPPIRPAAAVGVTGAQPFFFSLAIF